MGDRLTEEDNPSQTSPHPYGDIFDRLFPHYLVMGMTPEQYWDGEGCLKKFFREAYQLRIENERRMADVNNWYMGQYILCVLQTGALMVRGINVKEHTQLPEYPEQPFLIRMEEQKKEEARKKREEDQTKLAMAMFHAAIEKFNKNFRQRQETAGAVASGQ